MRYTTAATALLLTVYLLACHTRTLMAALVWWPTVLSPAALVAVSRLSRSVYWGHRRHRRRGARHRLGPGRGHGAPVAMPVRKNSRTGNNKPASDSTMNTIWWTWSLLGGNRPTRCTTQKAG